MVVRKLTPGKVLKVSTIVQVPVNVLALVSGIVSVVSFRWTSLDVFLDVCFLVALACNAFHVVACHLVLDHKKNKDEGRVNFFLGAHVTSWFFLVLASILNTFAVSLVQEEGAPVLVLTAALLVVLISLTFSFPLVAAILLLRLKARVPGWDDLRPVHDQPRGKARPSIAKALKLIGLVFIIGFYALGVYAPSIFIPGGADVQAYVAGNLAIVLLFLVYMSSIALVRLVPRRTGRRHVIFVAVIVVGSGTIALVNALPIMQLPAMLRSLDEQFESAFGPGWEDSIPEGKRAMFRPAPVLATQAFFGRAIPDVDQVLDIPYTFDKGRWLAVDWYGPAGINGTSTLLPVIIALHPGSWRYYDKGYANMFPVSRYLASQGYIVVDVSYGLLPTYNLNDMIREIGNLTKFLAANPGRFHADLNRTFFLGRSAGAHLALVAGLGYDSPYWAGNFSAGMKCAGIVQYYGPTNFTGTSLDDDQARWEAFLGANITDARWYVPVELVTNTSCPVLGFQGTSDTLVPPRHALELQEAAREKGVVNILGLVPYAGHAFDLFHGYPHNQACIYYMERFLAYLSST